MLLSADGAGIVEILSRIGKSKPCVWRWQERFAEDDVEGLLHDNTAPFGPEVAERVVALMRADPPSETTHWPRHDGDRC